MMLTTREGSGWKFDRRGRVNFKIVSPLNFCGSFMYLCRAGHLTLLQEYSTKPFTTLLATIGY